MRKPDQQPKTTKPGQRMQPKLLRAGVGAPRTVAAPMAPPGALPGMGLGVAPAGPPPELIALLTGNAAQPVEPGIAEILPLLQSLGMGPTAPPTAAPMPIPVPGVPTLAPPPEMLPLPAAPPVDIAADNAAQAQAGQGALLLPLLAALTGGNVNYAAGLVPQASATARGAMRKRQEEDLGKTVEAWERSFGLTDATNKQKRQGWSDTNAVAEGDFTNRLQGYNAQVQEANRVRDDAERDRKNREAEDLKRAESERKTAEGRIRSLIALTREPTATPEMKDELARKIAEYGGMDSLPSELFYEMTPAQREGFRQRGLDRAQRATLQDDRQEFTAEQNDLNRDLRARLAREARQHGVTMQEDRQKFQGEENAKYRETPAQRAARSAAGGGRTAAGMSPDKAMTEATKLEGRIASLRTQRDQARPKRRWDAQTRAWIEPSEAEMNAYRGQRTLYDNTIRAFTSRKQELLDAAGMKQMPDGRIVPKTGGGGPAGGGRTADPTRPSSFRTDPRPGRATAYGGVAPHVAESGNEVKRLFNLRDVGGMGTRSYATEHDDGLALDFMTHKDNSKGWDLARYMVEHGRAHNVRYVIFDNRINSLDGRGWRPYTPPKGATGPTARHEDHVHVSYAGTPLRTQLAQRGNASVTERPSSRVKRAAAAKKPAAKKEADQQRWAREFAAAATAVR